MSLDPKLDAFFFSYYLVSQRPPVAETHPTHLTGQTVFSLQKQSRRVINSTDFCSILLH